MKTGLYSLYTWVSENKALESSSLWTRTKITHVDTHTDHEGTHALSSSKSEFISADHAHGSLGALSLEYM